MASHPSRRLSAHVSDQEVTRHPGNTAGTERHDPCPLATLDPHGLLALSHTLFTCAEQSEIVRLAMRHVSALGSYHAEAGYLVTGDGLSRVPGHDAGAPTVDDAQMTELGEADGSDPFRSGPGTGRSACAGPAVCSATSWSPPTPGPMGRGTSSSRPSWDSRRRPCH